MHEELTSFEKGSGPGPELLDLHWDFTSPLSTPWNQAVVDLLVHKLGEMRVEKGWTTQPRSDAYWRDAIGNKFVSIKRLWTKSQPRAGESASQTTTQLMKLKHAGLKKTRADMRRRAVSY